MRIMTGRKCWERLSICSATALALAVFPDAASAAPHVESLGRDAGLPSAQVHAVEIAGGFAWFAGPGGLVRYSGGQPKVYRKAEGLSTHGLRSLALDHDQKLWIGTDVGVDVQRHDGRIHPLVEPGAWRSGFVEAMARAPDGGQWIATSQGLLHWSETAGLEAVREPGLRDVLVTALATDTAGATWVAAPSSGLLRHDRGGWRRVEAAGLSGLGSVAALAVSPRGVWVGGDRGLAELTADGTSWTARFLSEPDDPEAVSALLVHRDELWAGIGRQLRVYRQAGGRWLPAEVVLDNALVNDLVVDAQENVWAATDNLGVAKISALRRAIQRLETPCASQVFAVAPGPDGTYLVAGDTCSWLMEGETGKPVRRLAELDRIKTWDVLQSGDTWWAATENGLFRGDTGGKLSRVRLDSETGSAPGRALFHDGDVLWVGTVKGLVTVDGSRSREQLDGGGRPLGYVYTLEWDELHGHLWAGTIGNGLWRRTTAGFERVAAEHLADRGNTYDVAFGAGRVAVAQDDRLVILEDGRSFTLPVDGDDPVAAWSLVFDDSGTLWAGGLRGLVRYDLERKAAVQRLTATMGLGGEEFTTGRSLALGADGRLFCGHEAGLSTVNARKLAAFRERPEVRLIAADWSYASAATTDRGTVVRYGRWTLDASIAAPWFIDEKSLVYRHRLRGFDREWSAPQPRERHAIHYTGLPPGRYTLEAQARSPLVGWGPPADLLSFTVTPPWWLRPWALVLGALLLATAAAALWRWRTRRHRLRARALELEVRQRTRDLERVLSRVEHMAAHDPLTGLPNQRSFWEELKRSAALARRRGSQLALIVLDLDDFKEVNDTYGHQVGDQVLACVARRLVEVSRESDFLARYGGEEFVAVLAETSAAEAHRTADRLRKALSDSPYVAPDGTEVAVTASFGVTSWMGPEDDVESLFKRADLALYAAKATKNAVAVGNPQIDPQSPPN